MNHRMLNIPTVSSERVVVDEIFSDGKARILRAARKDGTPENDLCIRAWGDEREELISVWRLEAFVGFKTGRKLREGDVFLIADGSKLDTNYDPKKQGMTRDQARKEHLLVDWDTSKQDARMEVKQQTFMLSAVRLAGGNERALETLSRRVDKKFKSES